MFHEQLVKLRKKNQLTQKELANILQCSTSRIGMYEQGRRQPDFDTLNKLADLFHVTTDYLIGEPKKTPVILEETASYIQHPIHHPLTDYIKQCMKTAGLLRKNQSPSIDDMMLFVKFGENAAIEIIKERKTRI